MRRLTALAVAIGIGVLVPLPPVSVAATTGSIAGRVLHGDTQRPVANVEVTLSIIGSDDVDTKAATTDARGRYAFANLATGEELVYAVDARYRGGLFPGSPVTLPSDTDRPPVIDTTHRVWDTTSDPAAILIRYTRLFAVAEGSSAGIVESVTVVNPTSLAYIGRGAEMTDASSTAPSLGLSLPASAAKDTVRIQQADLDIPELIPTSYGFGITSAIPPGTTRITFSYELEGSAGTFDLSRRALYSIAEATIHARAPLVVDSDIFERAGQVEIDGKTYERWRATRRFDPADPIQANLVAAAGPSPALIGGLAAALGAVALLGAVAYRRSRRRSTAVPPTREREELVTAIAELDLEREAGGISEDEWIVRRAELKQRLATSSSGRDS